MPLENSQETSPDKQTALQILMQYKEDLPSKISILEQLIKAINENPQILEALEQDLSKLNIKADMIKESLMVELQKLQFSESRLVDLDDVVQSMSPENLAKFIELSSTENNGAKENAGDLEQIIKSLIEISGVKPDWKSTAKWVQIKAEHVLEPKKEALVDASYAVMLNVTARFLLNSLFAANQNSTTTPLEQSSSTTMSVDDDSIFSPASKILTTPLLVGAAKKFIDSIDLSGISDLFSGINSDKFWQTGNALTPFLAGTALASSQISLPLFLAISGYGILEAKAAKGNSDLMVYCGPQLYCDHLVEISKERGAILRIADRNEYINQAQKGARELILFAHGDEGAQIFFGDQVRNEPENVVNRVDYFTSSYFPNAKLIHVIGCKLGKDVEENFFQNSFKPGQVVFIYAGSNNIVDNDTKHHLILQSGNQQFPSAVPTQIIFKKDQKSSIIATIPPVPYQKIDTIISNKSITNERKFELLFTLINDHFNGQRSGILKKFQSYPEANSQITSVLDKIGFVDRSPLTADQRKELVKVYLSTNLIESEFSNEQKIRIIESKLVDLDFEYESGKTALSIAIESDNKELVVALTKHKATIRPEDLTMAVQTENVEILNHLLKSGANPNELGKTLQGRNALHFAVTQMRLKMVNALLVGGADPNKESENGLNAIHLAAKYGDPAIMTTLLKNGGNPLSKNAAGVSALDFAKHFNHKEVFDILLQAIAKLSKPNDPHGVQAKQVIDNTAVKRTEL